MVAFRHPIFQLWGDVEQSGAIEWILPKALAMFHAPRHTYCTQSKEFYVHLHSNSL